MLNQTKVDKMKVDKDLFKIMRATPRHARNIREENEAGAVVAAGIVICTLILVLAVFVNLCAR